MELCVKVVEQGVICALELCVKVVEGYNVPLNFVLKWWREVLCALELCVKMVAGILCVL